MAPGRYGNCRSMPSDLVQIGVSEAVKNTRRTVFQPVDLRCNRQVPDLPYDFSRFSATTRQLLANYGTLELTLGG